MPLKMLAQDRPKLQQVHRIQVLFHQRARESKGVFTIRPQNRPDSRADNCRAIGHRSFGFRRGQSSRWLSFRAALPHVVSDQHAATVVIIVSWPIAGQQLLDFGSVRFMEPQDGIAAFAAGSTQMDVLGQRSFGIVDVISASSYADNSLDAAGNATKLQHELDELIS